MAMGLPKKILIPKEISQEMKENDDALTDYLSDNYGYCVLGVDDKIIKGKHYAYNIKWDKN